VPRPVGPRSPDSTRRPSTAARGVVRKLALAIDRKHFANVLQADRRTLSSSCPIAAEGDAGRRRSARFRCRFVASRQLLLFAIGFRPALVEEMPFRILRSAGLLRSSITAIHSARLSRRVDRIIVSRSPAPGAATAVVVRPPMGDVHGESLGRHVMRKVTPLASTRPSRPRVELPTSRFVTATSWSSRKYKHHLPHLGDANPAEARQALSGFGGGGCFAL